MNMAHEPNKQPKHGHEKRDMNIRMVGYFFVGLFVLLVLTLLLMWGGFDYLAAEQAKTDMPPPPLADTRPQQPPAPRLQVNPPADLKDMRTQENDQLNSYGWIQPEAGVVHIPIERAKRLLLERGLPVREQPEPSNGGK